MKRKGPSLTDQINERTLLARVRGIYSAQCRRAEKAKLAPPDYTAADLLEVVRAALGTVDPYVLKTITVKRFSLDHKTPIDRGGGFERANVVVLHESANREKGALTLVEYSNLLRGLEMLKSTGHLTDYAVADIRRRLKMGNSWKHRTELSRD